MKKHLLAGAALALFATTGAFAAGNDPAGQMPEGAAAAPATSAATVPADAPAPNNSYQGSRGHQWTLEEARKHAHERADSLDKMTQAEWAEKQKKRQAWRDKWAHMTPEQKDAYKKARYAKRHPEAVPAAAAPASGGQ